MKNIKLALSPFALFAIVSCVTINVYFPAAAAQEAADKIVNEVLNQGAYKENIPATPKQPDNKNSDSSLNQVNQKQNFALKILNFIIPAAHAGANMSIQSPKIRSLRNQLKQHHSRLVPYFNQGNIGYSGKGLIKVRNTNGLNIKQKSTMKKLLSTANASLSSLYSEIAKANGHPEWKNDIQQTFAKTWVSQMQPGWMYFSGGQWKKK